MKTLSQRRLEFLDDTVKYYSEDVNRRATLTGGYICQYLTPDGRKCAIGRHIKKYDSEMEGHDVMFDVVFYSLPIKIKELGKMFLSQVQHLHDTSFYWNSEGLNKDGLLCYEEIKKYV